MKHALYLPPDSWNTELVLTGDEAEHAKALRLKSNEKILLLNGEGKTAICEVKTVKRKFAELAELETNFIEPPKSKAIMAIAISKAARRGFFFEKAAELGAWEIWLWSAQRSLSPLSPEILETSRKRLIAGIKQSKNPWLPKLRGFNNVHELITASAHADCKILPWEIQANLPFLETSDLGKNGQTVYVIGPEGGFDKKESDMLLNASFKPVSLGKRVLRCETAAALCLGLHYWAAQKQEIL